MKKRNGRSKIRALLFFFIVIFIICVLSYYIEEGKFIKIFDKVENETVSINNYYIYGTHFNVEGNLKLVNKISSIKNTKIVFIYRNGEELEKECKYKEEKDNLKCYISDTINDGIYLDEIDEGNYYIFLKIYYDNDEVKYYSFENKTQYGDLEYYTISNNNSNKKMNIKFSNIKKENKLIPFMLITSKKTQLPTNVYDISIDPGHGGSDPGAISGKYKEAEMALEYSLSLKKALEDLGLKVILTRDGTEDKSQNSKFNAYSIYDHDGRVNIVGRSKAKYNLSIHLNSLDVNSISGTEIYAPTNSNLKIAQSFADNIVNIAKTTYSTREMNKVSNGVYVRNFNETEIDNSNKEAQKNGYQPYNITTKTPYLYMIREVGGIVTGAYVDGRNTKYGANEYYNSNIGIESYLIELGYINNKKDLNNLLTNKEAYVEAMKNTIKEYICSI